MKIEETVSNTICDFFKGLKDSKEKLRQAGHDISFDNGKMNFTHNIEFTFEQENVSIKFTVPVNVYPLGGEKVKI